MVNVTISYDGSTKTITDPYHVSRVAGTDEVFVWYEKDGEKEKFENAEIIEVE